MLELILQILMVITGIIAIEVSYNSLLYRQKKTPIKIGILGIISVISTIITLLVCILLSNLKRIPYAGKIIRVVDFPFDKFFSYIPQWLLFVWFGIPIIIVWIVFAFRGGYVYHKIKAEYQEFLRKQKAKEEKESDPKSQPKKNKPEEKLIELSSNSAESKKTPPNKYFLGKEVKLAVFNHKSLKGLKKAIMHAKKGVVIGKTAAGYVAIYINGTGLKDLKKIFSKYSLDISELERKPSIVFFTHEKVKTRNLKQWIMKVRKAGEE